jgi:RimJ/RimL family protein N-acetyltransferase
MTATNVLGQPIGAPVDVALPRPFPPRLAMTGRYGSVLPVDVSHAPALFDAFRADVQDKIWTYLPYGPFDTVAGLTSWMELTCFRDDPLFHTICDEQGQPSGLASYLRIDAANGVAEVGHINLAPRLQRTRTATEAMYLMMGRIFDDLGYRRYEWKCDALNAPSRKAAERLGFTYEGTFRQATTYKGRNRDTAWYAIIDKDWPRIQSSFEAWLDPGNFDDRRQQRSPLQARA